MPKKFYLFLLALPLIMGFGLNFSCDEVAEKDGIDQMVKIIAAVSMIEGEADSILGLPAKLVQVKASKIPAKGALEGVGSDSLALGLNMLGVRTPSELPEPTMPQIEGPSSSGWYSVKLIYAGSEDSISIDVDLTAKARILNGSTPISVDISPLTSGSATDEQLSAAMESLFTQVDGATSLGVQFQLRGDIDVSASIEDIAASAVLKGAYLDAGVTVNLDTALDLNDLESLPGVSSVVLEYSVGSVITVASAQENIDCKIDYSYTLNINIDDPSASTGNVTMSLASGFMYLDVYSMTATANADGTTTGTITHGAETVTFTCTNGEGTYVYKGTTYDMNTGEPAS